VTTTPFDFAFDFPLQGVPGAALLSGLLLADRAVITDIETHGIRVGTAPSRVYDVRPMLDEREHSSACVEMARQALAWAELRGLVVFEPTRPHLARITARGIAL
jgi:hypothetical protein